MVLKTQGKAAVMADSIGDNACFVDITYLNL